MSGTAEDFKDVPRGKMRNYSPEAIGESSDKYLYNEKSDVYMFGTVLWELLHNRLVWSDCNTMVANKRILAGELPKIDENVIAFAPEGLIAIMLECMKYHYEERPTFKEVSEKLKALHQALRT